jgi:lipoyl-dependent peroxiredoxin subunit D
MNIENLISLVPDLYKDLRLNLQNIITPEGSSLGEKRLQLVSASVLLALKQKSLVSDFSLEENEFQAAQLAVNLMAMNNIYYRFHHALQHQELSVLKQLPAKLRMTQLSKSGVEKVDFELMCLAVSAIEGCAMCMESHALVLKNAGLSEVEIQGAVRVAAVLNSFVNTLSI